MGVRDLGGWVFKKIALGVIAFTLGFCISEKYQWIAGTEEKNNKPYYTVTKGLAYLKKTWVCTACPRNDKSVVW